MRIALSLCAVSFCLTGCSINPYVGFSMHLEKADSPEVFMPNPIGIIGVESKSADLPITAFCEHLSSIPNIEQGQGLNQCGLKLYY